MNDLEVLSTMSKKGMDIRMSATATNFTCGKKNGTVQMMIDCATAQQVMQSIAAGENKFILALYVVDKEQFFKLKPQEYKP